MTMRSAPENMRYFRNPLPVYGDIIIPVFIIDLHGDVYATD
ncbi:hypothetical protein [Escherichia coli]|nr:hypothetical protein [Escherichia coli]